MSQFARRDGRKPLVRRSNVLLFESFEEDAGAAPDGARIARRWAPTDDTILSFGPDRFGDGRALLVDEGSCAFVLANRGERRGLGNPYVVLGLAIRWTGDVTDSVLLEARSGGGTVHFQCRMLSAGIGTGAAYFDVWNPSQLDSFAATAADPLPGGRWYYVEFNLAVGDPATAPEHDVAIRVDGVTVAAESGPQVDLRALTAGPGPTEVHSFRMDLTVGAGATLALDDILIQLGGRAVAGRTPRPAPLGPITGHALRIDADGAILSPDWAPSPSSSGDPEHADKIHEDEPDDAATMLVRTATTETVDQYQSDLGPRDSDYDPARVTGPVELIGARLTARFTDANPLGDPDDLAEVHALVGDFVDFRTVELPGVLAYDGLDDYTAVGGAWTEIDVAGSEGFRGRMLERQHVARMSMGLLARGG